MPLGIAAALVQASIYDVPGGYRAVMFDRFAGVKDKVLLCPILPSHRNTYFWSRPQEKAHISSFLGCNVLFSTIAVSSLE